MRLTNLPFIIGAISRILLRAVSIGVFSSVVLPTAVVYPKYCSTYSAFYDDVRSVLDRIPENASVTATTFYTTQLSQREILYDIQYCSRDHMLSTEYVALNIKSTGSYKKYGSFENVVKLLQENGYVLFAEKKGTLVIYRKAQ